MPKCLLHLRFFEKLNLRKQNNRQTLHGSIILHKGNLRMSFLKQDFDYTHLQNVTFLLLIFVFFLIYAKDVGCLLVKFLSFASRVLLSASIPSCLCFSSRLFFLCLFNCISFYYHNFVLQIVLQFGLQYHLSHMLNYLCDTEDTLLSLFQL